MREQFIERTFKPSSMKIIEQANKIITEYQRDGYQLTLRQLYYQFVSRALIANKLTEYKRLGGIINDGRLAGLIDWSAIEDRGRNLRTHSSWSSPAEIVRTAADGYAIDLWETQEYRPEVWIEKDALVGVIERVCNQWRVPYFACRGYNSQSEAYAAGKRMWQHQREGKTPIIFHLGDHDPSGLDMTRDNTDRLAMFSRGDVEVRRLALHMTQVEECGPPPNPAKETDSRAAPYIAAFGNSSWELDALEPKVIAEIVRRNIESVIDHDLWAISEEREEAEREVLREAADKMEAA